MKKLYLKSQLVKFIFVVAVLLTTHSIGALAQLSDPGSDPDVPIDGGLSILLAAGVGYGIRELKKKKGDKNV